MARAISCMHRCSCWIKPNTHLVIIRREQTRQLNLKETTSCIRISNWSPCPHFGKQCYSTVNQLMLLLQRLQLCDFLLNHPQSQINQQSVICARFELSGTQKFGNNPQKALHVFPPLTLILFGRSDVLLHSLRSDITLINSIHQTSRFIP